MPSRISPSQLRSKLQQAQSKQRQAIQRYNSNVRQYNAERKRQIDAYNQAARSYNSRLRANRDRLQSELQRLSRQPATVRHTSLRQSLVVLSTAYDKLDGSGADPFLADLAERETANSVSLVNLLLGDNDQTQEHTTDLAATKIGNSLSTFSEDLQNRWAGAIFALNPANPDAARHFCTSTREIISEMLNTAAPDEDVFAVLPDCQVSDRGTPTRRAKIHYCLDRNGLTDVFLESFVEANTKDLIVLFDDLNSGAHGTAGKFNLQQLVGIKNRVEDTIDFMCQIVVKPNLRGVDPAAP